MKSSKQKLSVSEMSVQYSKRGIMSFQDEQLLAAIIGKKASNILMKKNLSLTDIFTMNIPALTNIKGIGKAIALRIVAFDESFRRITQERHENVNLLANSEASINLFKERLYKNDKERFEVAYLNSANHIISVETMFEGTLDGASVYKREILIRCMELKALSVILAHNHPSGESNPSPTDITLTEQIREALSLINIRLLDHIIVGKGKAFSFADNNLL